MAWDCRSSAWAVSYANGYWLSCLSLGEMLLRKLKRVVLIGASRVSGPHAVATGGFSIASELSSPAKIAGSACMWSVRDERLGIPTYTAGLLRRRAGSGSVIAKVIS